MERRTRRPTTPNTTPEATSSVCHPTTGYSQLRRHVRAVSASRRPDLAQGVRVMTSPGRRCSPGLACTERLATEQGKVRPTRLRLGRRPGGHEGVALAVHKGPPTLQRTARRPGVPLDTEGRHSARYLQEAGLLLTGNDGPDPFLAPGGGQPG